MSFPWYRKNNNEERRRKSVEQGLKNILGNVFVSQEGSSGGDVGDNQEGKDSESNYLFCLTLTHSGILH